MKINASYAKDLIEHIDSLILFCIKQNINDNWEKFGLNESCENCSFYKRLPLLDGRPCPLKALTKNPDLDFLIDYLYDIRNGANHQ